MSTRYTLPGELTIYTAADTRTALLNWLAEADGDDTLAVAADQVLEVDAAGVQLLCSLGAQLDREGRPWRIEDCTATLAQAFELLGLGDWLAPLWSTAAADNATSAAAGTAKASGGDDTGAGADGARTPALDSAQPGS